MAIKIINPIISEAVGGGGASFNIHYGLNPPEDTSMLWVETDKQPSETTIVGADYAALKKNISTLPTSMSRMGAAAVGTKIYLFGGINSMNNYLNTILVFDTTTNTYETLSTVLPYLMANIATVAVGTKIYLFGGYNGATKDTILVFDTTTNNLDELETVLPEGAWRIATGVVGTKIYLFGGEGATTTYLNTINVFDTETNKIDTLSVTTPYAASGFVSATVGTKIYLFCGYVGTYHTGIPYVFDTEQYTWTELTNPINISGGICPPTGVIDNVIYVFGGNTSNAALNRICVYDIDNPVSYATHAESLPSVVMYHAGAQVGDTVYLFGGQTSSGSGFLKAIHSFNPKFELAENISRVYVSLTSATNRFSLLSGENNIECRIYKDYIGNADGKPEQQTIYLYKNDQWTAI